MDSRWLVAPLLGICATVQFPGWRDQFSSPYDQIKSQATKALFEKQYSAASDWARQLVQLAEAAERKGVVDKVAFGPFKETELAFATDLLHDMQRRLRQGPSDSIPAGSETTLIDAMDSIKGAQVHKLSSAVNYSADPVYQAILDQGQAIIPALIDVVDRDRRFTAMFMVSGGMSEPTYSLHPVAEIAEELIGKIWPSSPPYFTSDRHSIVTALRKAWVFESKKTVYEQWAEVLARDDAGPDRWLEAARYLVSPRVWIPSSNVIPKEPDSKAPLKAGPLQARRRQEIASLMAKRAMKIIDVPTQRDFHLQACVTALSMGECLAIWSPGTCVLPLRRLAQRVKREILQRPADGPFCAEGFSKIIAYRLDQNDRTAIADLSDVIGTFARDPFMPVGQLKVLWKWPHDVDMSRVVDKYMSMLTQDAMSTNLQVVCDLDFMAVEMYRATPLLADSGFRKMLVTACENKTPGIEAWTTGTDEMRFLSSEGPVGSVDLNGIQPEQPINVHVPVSAGDYIAQTASRIHGAPPFCMIWPELRRAAAKAELIKWLQDENQDWLKVAKS